VLTTDRIQAIQSRIERLSAKLAAVNSGDERSELLSQHDLRALVSIQLSSARTELANLLGEICS
jgi:predicted  nucleic acid-binding Zn-ribbon protein